MENIRKVENAHVALWLLKDVSWCAAWHALGMLMVLPTFGVTLHITWKMRHLRAELIHNLAVFGEFFLSD